MLSFLFFPFLFLNKSRNVSLQALSQKCLCSDSGFLTQNTTHHILQTDFLTVAFKFTQKHTLLRFCVLFFFFKDQYCQRKWLLTMLLIFCNSIFSFWRTSILFIIVAAPTNSVGGLQKVMNYWYNNMSESQMLIKLSERS